jgi:sodium/bile acid cotransporter 7
MNLRAALTRLAPDPFVLALLACAALASLLPASGAAAVWLQIAANIAIGLLFFLHGARLSHDAVLAGLRHWRLHLVILCATFALYPLLGLGLTAIAPLSSTLLIGLLFVCLLPSTVQSSIAYTSIAGGNIAAAVVAATLSNLIGIFVTPLLASIVLHAQGFVITTDQIVRIALNLLAPFLLGHALRPWIGAWVARHKALLSLCDRSAILLAVYSAFSVAMVQGVWSRIGGAELAILIVAAASLLAFVIVVLTLASRLLGFNKEDEIAIVFCGAKKSLATGIPMASVLFSGATLAGAIIPLMIYHQMELMTAAWLSRRYAVARANSGA